MLISSITFHIGLCAFVLVTSDYMNRYDDMIPVEVGKQFIRLFDHAELHVYEGAHWLPMDVEFGPVIRKFLQKFWVIDDSN